jgi:hypothetical protein
MVSTANPHGRLILVIDVFYGTKFPLIRKAFLPDDLVRVVKANLDPPAASTQQ